MAKKIISLDELAYFKSLLANVAVSGDYDDLEDKPLWIGTQTEYETAASTIPVGTVIIITDDDGSVIAINYADLTNKPQINGNTLTGNKTGAQLGLVDAVSGKGLSTNDYTTSEKSKLSGIETGAEVNIIEQIKVNNVAQAVDNKTVNLTFGTAAAKNSTSSVTANSTDLVESGAVKTAIDAAMVSAYKAGGSKTCAELTSALLVAANEGYVFTMSDTGTTTSDFIEGAGKEIGVGADVGVIKRDSVYKFNLLPGIIDTSNFITKSATTGLVKNDGSIDTTTYISDISGKADKVTSATNGNFAGLDSNGNLTDSGKKSSDFATSTQGGKADTAIQTIKIGGTAQTKTDGVVDLPTYPTTLPASDTTSTYSATGTVPVNGTAVAAALGTLDVSEVGGSGKYIQKISETDGKISATAQDLNATAVGLGSVVNTGDSATPVENGTTKFTTGGAYTELAKKVDKVSGKGLSTNDYTTEEKNKLSGVESGAEENVIESVSLGGTAQTITNKNVDLSVAEYDEVAGMFGRELVATFNYHPSSSWSNAKAFLYSDGTVIIKEENSSIGHGYFGKFPEEYLSLIKRIIVKGSLFFNANTIKSIPNLTELSFYYDSTKVDTEFSYGFHWYGVYLCNNLLYIKCPKYFNIINPDAEFSYHNTNLRTIEFERNSLITEMSCPLSMDDISLETIYLPDHLTTIDLTQRQTVYIYNAPNLKHIYIPVTLTTISALNTTVFYNCPNITDVYYQGTQAQWEAITGIENMGLPAGCTIHYEYNW